MKTVTTVTTRKAIIRPMFVSKVVKPPLAVGHRQWLGDASGPGSRASRQANLCCPDPSGFDPYRRSAK
jgi:hypothetical protein